jgi:cytidylate kinase
MYRCIAWKSRKLGLTDPLQIAAMIRSTRLSVGHDLVTCDGEDVTRAIRDPQVTAAVRPIAASPECRAELVRMQQDIGKAGGLVTEGRDQGSVVFPDAEFKFYIDASADVRARRRQLEEGGDLESIRGSIERRDAEDKARKAGPLARPEGAIVVDTSGLTLEQVVARILASIGTP